MTSPHETEADTALLDAFETCRLDPERFHHADHLKVAWLLLRQAPLLVALDRMSSGLRRFTASVGQADRYHETITFAWVFLVNERRARSGRELGWDEFAANHADLFTGPPPYALLGAYYREETLRSELARATWVMPDRCLRAGGAAIC